MKRLVAILLCAVLMCTGAFAMEAGMDMSMLTPEIAFAGPTDEFSMPAAWYLLANFMAQGQAGTAAQMQAAGLTVAVQAHYGKSKSDAGHTSAFTMGVGQLPVRGEARNVAVITVRGTADGEWYSNFDIAGVSFGEAGYAENFKAASDDIYARVMPEIEKLDDPVVIVTGYSRGAACANLLGVMFNESIGMEDVYAYTFATPNTVRGEVEGNGNIFNLVNVNDAVTCMPLEVWGFSRAGVDIELREEGYVNTGMHLMFIAMLGLCPDIDSYYNERHSLTQPGLSDDGITGFELMTAFAAMMNGDEAAAQQAQAILAAAGSAQNDFSEFLALFSTVFMNAEVNQHDPSVYIGLMNPAGGAR